MSHAFSILSLDSQYQPHRWLSVQDAILHEATNEVIDHLGESVIVYHGGTNKNGERSFIETNSIIVLNGAPNARRYKEPSLTNPGLFQRDRHVCAYCGNKFKSADLTRDHIHPQSKGGKDTWMNAVTACFSCNNLKGDTLPGHKLPGGVMGPQFNGKLDPLYLPYVPCKAEHQIMRGRNIRADQMMFLLERVSNKQSRVFEYAKDLFGDQLAL